MRYLVIILFFLCGLTNIKAWGSYENLLIEFGNYNQLVNPLYGIFVAHHNKDQEGYWQLGETIFLQTITTEIMKYGLNNTKVQGQKLGQRPRGGTHNFPSGHTSLTTASAWFIKERYGWSYGLPAIALAAVTGYSRVYSGYHTMNAVGFGALIGILSAEIVTTKIIDSSKNQFLSVDFIPYGVISISYTKKII